MKEIKFPNTSKLLRALLRNSTQTKIARAANMSPQHLQNMVRGASGVPGRKVMILSHVLRCEPKRFISAAILDFTRAYKKDIKNNGGKSGLWMNI